MRRNIIKDFKTIKSNYKNLRDFVKEKYNVKDKTAFIDVYINKADVFDNFSNPNSPELSPSFIEYIDNAAYYIPLEYMIEVNVHTGDDIDISYVEKKLNEVYMSRLADKNDDLKRNSITSISLTIIGIIFLSLYFILQILPNASELFNEIFSIIGTFSLWEAVDYFLINRSALKIDKLNIAQSAFIKVNKIK